jgi:hypothetical protein
MITQRGYIRKMLEEFSFTNCNPLKVPMIENLKHTNDTCTPLVDATIYGGQADLLYNIHD